MAELRSALPLPPKYGQCPVVVEDTGNQRYFFQLNGAGADNTLAEDVLTWTAQFESEWKLIREAAQRPGAYAKGDYDRPFNMPIPNFVAVRQIGQIVADRAYAQLLLQRPAAALVELDTIQYVNRCLTSGVPALVSSMISVAMQGLSLAVIEFGLTNRSWLEPQLVAIQNRVQGLNCIADVSASLRVGETLAMLQETSSRKRLIQLWGDNSLFWQIVPQGWLQQNRARYLNVMQHFDGGIEADKIRVFPEMVAKEHALMEAESQRNIWPFGLLCAFGIPNFTKAYINTTKTQTRLHQAALACALDRYRQAEGAYPEKLDALVPRFIGNLPHDVVNGEPLKFRRTESGGYRLYSVGWNLKDEGGKADKDNARGDWLWEKK